LDLQQFEFLLAAIIEKNRQFRFCLDKIAMKCRCSYSKNYEDCNRARNNTLTPNVLTKTD